MRHLTIIAFLLTLVGCGAGCNAEPEPQPVKLAPATQTQWCTIDPATGVATAGNACPH